MDLFNIKKQCEYDNGELIIVTAKKFMKIALNLAQFQHGLWMLVQDTIANCFRHYKLRSTDNMTFENSDEGGESTQELQNLIKELGYRNAMDVEDVLTHPEENVVAQLLTDEEIIESVLELIKIYR
ncbi:hypothetical protein Tco_0436357 [Tanacetum coccineum]